MKPGFLWGGSNLPKHHPLHLLRSLGGRHPLAPEVIADHIKTQGSQMHKVYLDV